MLYFLWATTTQVVTHQVLLNPWWLRTRQRNYKQSSLSCKPLFSASKPVVALRLGGRLCRTTLTLNMISTSMKVKHAFLTTLCGLFLFVCLESCYHFSKRPGILTACVHLPTVYWLHEEEGSKNWHPGNSVTIFSKCPLLFKIFWFYMQNNRAKWMKINIFSRFRKQRCSE